MNISLTEAYDYYFIHNIAKRLEWHVEIFQVFWKLPCWNFSGFLKIDSCKYVSVVSDVNAVAESCLIVHKTFSCELISH
jgi:hypothetical protein